MTALLSPLPPSLLVLSYLGSTLRQMGVEPMPSLYDVRRVITEHCILPMGEPEPEPEPAVATFTANCCTALLHARAYYKRACICIYCIIMYIMYMYLNINVISTCMDYNV